MALNKEIMDFLRGWSTVNAISDQYDDSAYRKLRNQLAQQKLQDLQDPEMRKLDRELKRQRANYLGAMSQRVVDPNFGRRGDPLFDPNYDPTATKPGLASPPQAPGGDPATAPAVAPAAPAVPTPTPAPRPIRQSALDLDGTDNDEDDGTDPTQPTQFAAKGGLIKPTQGVKGYAAGGAVDDDDDEGDDNAEEESTESNPERPSYSYNAADDAVRAALAYGRQAFALDQAPPAGGVPDPAYTQQRQQRVRAYLSGAGAQPPSMLDVIYKKIDPQGKMTEAQRTMAGYSALWQFYMQHQRPDLAQKAAFAMLQTHRLNAAHYSALSKAALEHGHLDTAAQFAAKAFANVPNGKDVRVSKDASGRLIYEAIDDRTGQPIKKGILSPQEIGAWVMETTPDKFDELIHQLAGKPLKQGEAEKPESGSKATLKGYETADARVQATYDDANKGGDAEAISPAMKHVASEIFASNGPSGIDPSSALDVAKRLLHIGTGAKGEKGGLQESKVLDDGARVVDLEDGRQIKVSRNTWLMAAALRGEELNKAGKELIEGAKNRVPRNAAAAERDAELEKGVEKRREIGRRLPGTRQSRQALRDDLEKRFPEEQGPSQEAEERTPERRGDRLPGSRRRRMEAREDIEARSPIPDAEDAGPEPDPELEKRRARIGSVWDGARAPRDEE